MAKLTREKLDSLEKYSENRNAFRQQVIEHKKNRRVALGENASLYFEDEITMRYQVQEMLRIEKIFEADGIQDEIEVYNPLIPDGNNWKATFMIEYSDEEERRKALAKLKGIDKHVWIRVADCDPVYAISNEDLQRESDDKTAAVHFMRFELTDDMIARAKNGEAISMGIDHEVYNVTVDQVADNIRQSLVGDFH